MLQSSEEKVEMNFKDKSIEMLCPCTCDDRRSRVNLVADIARFFYLIIIIIMLYNTRLKRPHVLPTIADKHF